jgi:hypothetical protein
LFFMISRKLVEQPMVSVGQELRVLLTRKTLSATPRTLLGKLSQIVTLSIEGQPINFPAHVCKAT